MKYFLTLPFLVFTHLINAQQSIKYDKLDVVSINKSNHLPSSFIFKQNNSNRPTANNINLWFQQNLNANSEFNLVNISRSKDQAGFTHLKYIQLYNNIPVEGSMFNAHFKDGEMQSMNGNFFTNLNVTTNPVLDENMALSNALSQYGAVEFAWQNPMEEAFLKQIQGNPSATYLPKGQLVIISKNYSLLQEEFRLAYKFNIYITEPLAREMVYIDAINGEILYTEQLIQTNDVKGFGTTRYSGIQSFMCDSLKSDSFILRNSSKGNGIQTYNAKQTSKLDTNRVFKNDSNYWNLKNAAQDEVALDVQWGMEKAYDFYKEKLGINSINDSGYKMMAQVHYRTKYNNANWNGQLLNFGDGDGVTFRPLTSIDVCGHEMTHGLTQKSAGLIYKDESGGLNESFSDIFGKCIEHYALPDSFTWLVGAKIQFNGNFLRSMEDPTLKNNPKFYDGQFFVQAGSAFDNGGVHINSGISNYWFYLLCEGGSGVRESDNKPFTVQSIGWDKATAIAYATLSNYLVPTSEFFDASDLSQLVARNLYGENSNEAQQVLMAWYGVGLATLPGSNVSDIVKKSAGISFSPNPAEHQIKISLNSNQLFNGVIFDITGKKIKEISVFNGATIDISELENGIYMLGFEDGSAIKFVKI